MRNGDNLKGFTWWVLLLTTLMSTYAVCAQSAPDSDSARVLALEKLWNQAEVAKDASALDHLLADDFIFVDIDGSLQIRSSSLIALSIPSSTLRSSVMIR